MSKSIRIDITGKKFGRLTVLRYSYSADDGQAHWECRCDCGNITTPSGSVLRRGKVKSCGCLRAEVNSYVHRTHGKNGTAEHRIWNAMLNRCRNPKSKNYKYWGGRGIKVCKRWHKFENFLEDMGKRPSPKHSLDRIDNNQGYSKKNCRWATTFEQNNNKRSNLIIEFRGEKRSRKEWSLITGIASATIWSRWSKGWSAEEILTTPVKHVGQDKCRETKRLKKKI